MNQIQGAIRQHLFEILNPLYDCKIGSDHKDCSYLDYSEALELWVKGELLLIICGSRNTPDGDEIETGSFPSNVRIIWSGGPMLYRDILTEEIVPEIEEPDFASFTRRIIDVIANFRMVSKDDCFG